MRVGISTACFYPMETEKALGQLIEGGIPCTEIFINAFEELKPPFVRTLRTMLQGGATTVTSLHPFTSEIETMLFFDNYSRRYTDGLEIYKRYFEVAAELGAAYIVLHGGYARRNPPADFYIERYSRLHEYAKAFGVYIAQENVGRCASCNPALLRQMREAIPDVRFVLDLKQTYRSQCSIGEVMAAMGSNLAHLHFSDARPGADCLPVGEGEVDFLQLLRDLHKQGYTGDALLELYTHSYSGTQALWDSADKLAALSNFLAKQNCKK